MAVGFKRVGPMRAAQRHRLFFVGSTALVFALLITGILLLIYGQNTAQAGLDDRAISTASTEQVAFGTVTLLAPTVSIAKGSKITSDMLKELPWPRDQVPAGVIRKVDDIRDMFAMDNLSPDQPIVKTSVSSSPPQIGIGELLPAGHRAMTIEVDATSGVEGWATAGAHVDVFVTYIDQKDRISKTRLAVEDAVVLSYGGSAKAASSTEEKVTPATTVTLAVTFKDSLKLQTARAIGRITLALRNVRDVKSQGDEVFAADQWDSDENASKKTPNTSAKGFARIHTQDGEKQFFLGNDEKWWQSEGED
jgi:Flp pilus assembly protein CpaB